MPRLLSQSLATATIFVLGLVAHAAGQAPSRYQSPQGGAGVREQTPARPDAGGVLNSRYQQQPAKYAPPYAQGSAAPAGRYGQGAGASPTTSTGSTRGGFSGGQGQRGPIYTAQAPQGTTRAGTTSPQSPRIPAGVNSGLNGQAPNTRRQVPNRGQAPNTRGQVPNRGPGVVGPAAGASTRPPGATANMNPPQRPAPIGAPFGPLNPQKQKYIDTLLAYWEYSTKDIERYECTFQLWRYDPVFGPRDPNVPVEWSEGVIKYESPDRGLYKVEKSKLYRRPEKPGEKAEWSSSKTPGDHWVCDGKSLFEFDWNRKLLITRALPPNVRGIHIANGPLPFLLKAKAAQVKARFWVRGIESPRKGEYWVEAFPKRRSDAANFQKLHIVLNEEYMPKALVVFNPGFRPDRPARTTYEFAGIQRNPQLPWFGRAFIVTAPPAADWRSVEEKIPEGVGPRAPQSQVRRP